MESRFLSGVQEPWGLRIGPNCGKRASCYLRFDFSDLPYSSGICVLKGRISLGWFCHPNQSLLHSSPLKVDLLYVLPMCHWLWLGSRSRAILCGRKPFTAVSMHGPIVSWYSQPTHEVGTIINFIVFSLWGTDFISSENICRNGVAVSYGSSEPTLVLLPESHGQRSLVGHSS